MSSEELRDMAVRAVMASMTPSQHVDPFVLEEESLAAGSHAGHHGYAAGGGDDKGCWAIENGEFINRYVWNGSRMIEGSRCTTDGFESKIAAVIVNNVDGRVQVVAFSSINNLNVIARQPEIVVIPLYEFDDKGLVKVDFRNIARGGSWGMIV